MITLNGSKIDVKFKLEERNSHTEEDILLGSVIDDDIFLSFAVFSYF